MKYTTTDDLTVRHDSGFYVAEHNGVEYGRGRTASEAIDRAAVTICSDVCELCAEPASVTLRLGSETIRICRGCFRAGWLRNRANPERWTAFLDPEHGPQEDEGEGDEAPASRASWSTAPLRERAVACA